MKEMVILNKKEHRRLAVLNDVERGKLIGREAAELLDLSLRHVRRILAAYRKEGAQALEHGNWGRKPGNTLDESLKKRVVELAQSTYAGCNVQYRVIAPHYSFTLYVFQASLAQASNGQSK